MKSIILLFVIYCHIKFTLDVHKLKGFFVKVMLRIPGMLHLLPLLNGKMANVSDTVNTYSFIFITVDCNRSNLQLQLAARKDDRTFCIL